MVQKSDPVLRLFVVRSLDGCNQEVHWNVHFLADYQGVRYFGLHKNALKVKYH